MFSSLNDIDNYTLQRPFLHIHGVGKALLSAGVLEAAVFCRRVGEWPHAGRMCVVLWRGHLRGQNIVAKAGGLWPGVFPLRGPGHIQALAMSHNGQMLITDCG